MFGNPFKGHISQSPNQISWYWFGSVRWNFRGGLRRCYCELFDKTPFLSFLEPEVPKKKVFFRIWFFENIFFSLSKFFIFHFLDFYSNLLKKIDFLKGPFSQRQQYIDPVRRHLCSKLSLEEKCACSFARSLTLSLLSLTLILTIALHLFNWSLKRWRSTQIFPVPATPSLTVNKRACIGAHALQGLRSITN